MSAGAILDGAARPGRAADAQAVGDGQANAASLLTAVAESEVEGEPAVEIAVAMRDRMVAAYEDIMRMPIR